MTTDLEKQAGKLLLSLEEYWQAHYPERGLHERLTEMLYAAREALAQNNADVRLIIATRNRLLRHEISVTEMKKANETVKRLLKSLGIMVVGLLPLSFITLPGLFALAHYSGIDLLSPKPSEEKRRSIDPS